MKYRRKRSISEPAALVLLVVFAAVILGTLLTGAGAYKRLVERGADSFDSRTCVQYLATKIRQAPSPDSVELSDFGDEDCLLIREQIDSDTYQTRIYCHNGWLMELFAVADGDFAPEDGEKIMPMTALCIEQTGAVLRFDITDNSGEDSTFLLTIRGKEGSSNEE